LSGESRKEGGAEIENRLADVTRQPHLVAMSLRERWNDIQQIQAVRTVLLVSGILLMLASPAVGLLPGPGGIVVFGGGLALTLKYSEWAKRRYVRFKRKHPRKGAWTDWGLRRASAKRRQHREKAKEALPHRRPVAADVAADD
jgi:hypothetical protein